MLKFSRAFPWIAFGSDDKVAIVDSESEPLREFIYLDEVSLASLLASQKGEITENITSQIEEGRSLESGGKVGVNGPLLPSAEASSRFQTTNSTALQTVRKANAQSLFRELHELEHLRKIKPTKPKCSAASFSEFIASLNSDSAFKAQDLKRGDLVEFKVKLSASWIFQISTMVAEFSEMFDESPTLFLENVKFSDLYQAKNVNKIINKLLAGLIPIDGLVTEYGVVEYEGEDYIIHSSVIKKFGLDNRPLQIVGVTEHLAYWKDIRRILFADSEFTVLCRLSKSGLQTDWNPIKVADIFSQFAPDLAGQIEVSSRAAIAQSSRAREEPKPDGQSQKLMVALLRYKDLLVAQLDREVSTQEAQEIDRSISNLRLVSNSAEGQRAAFAQTKAVVEDLIGETIDPNADLELRARVRQIQDLPLLPRNSDPQQGEQDSEPVEIEKTDNRLLDVEVVAIYW
ncbi:hypothetical protein EB810_14475 [Altererythrobacter sp. FM1]|uniref:DUF6414 family protein n=1 Tax=Tsuneonella flava TaxID=2055955 RepID=UPI000C807718|nr:hypothetical protein [Tsuneonella flava]ROT93301.1 hypothetical protein EB810_14475 [Altererythrobacter sp. FM1]